MNLDEDILKRTYFIGGPPRVGKSLLAYKLATQIGGHVVSTDSIRNAAKKACSDKESDLFIINKTENISKEEWLDRHLNRPEEVVEFQNRESKAVWPSVVSFCSSFAEDQAIHIVEGVALLPLLVAQVQPKVKNIFYIGNTNNEHIEGMMKYAKDFPEQDWMMAMGYDVKQFQGMAAFIKSMSFYFKEEAQKYGFPYYEIDDFNFESSLEKIVQKMTTKII